MQSNTHSRIWFNGLLVPKREYFGGRSVPRGTEKPPVRLGRLFAQSDEMVVGIDLGTTNSVISIVQNGCPVVVASSEGHSVTPSVVSFQKDGTVLVGLEAKKRASLAPETTYFSVKRLVGRSYADVEEEADRLPYEIMEGPTGEALLVNPLLEKGFTTPEEVSSLILRKMISSVEELTGLPVKKAVVSVPAYFDRSQQEATCASGELAGLEKVKLIKEPVASALGYGLDIEEDQTVLVFDLGGGTLDVSILEVGGGVIEVLATGGDPRLGGDDWDAAIVDWLVKEYLIPAKVSWRDPNVMSKLKNVAEYAKMKLSSGDTVALRIPLGRGIKAVLTQRLLEKLSSELFVRARKAVDFCCVQAGVEPVMITKQDQSGGIPTLRPKRRNPVSEVLLVGGSTKMPIAKHFVQNMTGFVVKDRVVDPDEAVALGAAVQAGVLQGDVEDVMTMDVFQASLMRAFAKEHMEKMSLDDAD